VVLLCNHEGTDLAPGQTPVPPPEASPEIRHPAAECLACERRRVASRSRHSPHRVAAEANAPRFGQSVPTVVRGITRIRPSDRRLSHARTPAGRPALETFVACEPPRNTGTLHQEKKENAETRPRVVSSWYYLATTRARIGHPVRPRCRRPMHPPRSGVRRPNVSRASGGESPAARNIRHIGSPRKRMLHM
jgi:hypothetical protein